MTDDQLVEIAIDCPLEVTLPWINEPLWLIGVVETRDGRLCATIEKVDGSIFGVPPNYITLASPRNNACRQL